MLAIIRVITIDYNDVRRLGQFILVTLPSYKILSQAKPSWGGKPLHPRALGSRVALLVFLVEKVLYCALYISMVKGYLSQLTIWQMRLTLACTKSEPISVKPT